MEVLTLTLVRTKRHEYRGLQNQKRPGGAQLVLTHLHGKLGDARPRSRETWASREENPVVFAAELREVGFCRRWVGFEVEAVPRILRGCGRNGNRRRALEEVPAKLIRRVAESEHAPGHAAPSDFQ